MPEGPRDISSAKSETRSALLSTISKGRIVSIDALRGMAAFWVVLFHVFGQDAQSRVSAVSESWGVDKFLYVVSAFGYIGVYLFFVISGFCIHIRWAKSRSKEKPEVRPVPFFEFWKRRWVRLYPAYLAAMLLFLLWEAYQGKLVLDSFFTWDIVSHVLMLHNFDNRTVYSLNGVFWTLAVEEQLYLLYFLLLALRDRFGWSATMAVTFLSRFLWLGVSLTVTKLLGFEIPFSEGSLANWWIWALGVVSVENYFGLIKLPRWSRSITLACTFFIIAGGLHYFGNSTDTNKDFTDLGLVFEPFLWGAGFFALVNYATANELEVSRLKIQILSILGFVGIFSYSLYLTHELVLQVLQGFGVYPILGACLVFAYLFFLIFEKPFMLYLVRQRNK